MVKLCTKINLFSNTLYTQPSLLYTQLLLYTWIHKLILLLCISYCINALLSAITKLSTQIICYFVCVFIAPGPGLTTQGTIKLVVFVVWVEQTIHCIFIIVSFNHRIGERGNFIDPSTLRAACVQTLLGGGSMQGKEPSCVPRGTGHRDNVLIGLRGNMINSSHAVSLGCNSNIPELTCMYVQWHTTH